MVISAVVCYRIQVGSERFWADVRSFPNSIKELARADGHGAKAHALFGFAGATILTYLLGPSLSGAVGIGVLAALGTLYRPVLIGGLSLAWKWVTRRVAPQHEHRAPAQAVTVTTLGGAGAMALAIVISEPSLRFLFAIVAVIAAVVLSRGRPRRLARPRPRRRRRRRGRPAGEDRNGGGGRRWMEGVRLEPGPLVELQRLRPGPVAGGVRRRRTAFGSGIGSGLCHPGRRCCRSRGAR